MAVTEPQRLDLHAAARAALGPEEGDTLMASLPPANTDIATRQDLERVETGLRRDIDHAVQRSEASMKAYIWKVVVGTGVALAITIVALVLGGVTVIVQVLGIA
jgi:hypothetical protein